MQEIFEIIKKYRSLIFGGLGIVIFLAILDPAVEFVSNIFESEKKPVVQTDPDWQRFTNIQCGFTVSFPSPPFAHRDPLNNDPRVIFYKQFVSVLGSNQVFMVATLLSSLTNQLTTKQSALLLDKTMAGAMQNGDTLIYRREITDGTNPGREFEFEKPDKTFLKMRYFRAGRYFQTLMVSEPPDGKDSTNAEYFFNSFSLLRK
jgi:hypothetical protein